MSLILKLDAAGTPLKWISKEDAAIYYAKGKVAWTIGNSAQLLRGGINRDTGQQSVIKTECIIAVIGEGLKRRNRGPALSNKTLFKRDNYTCAYCNKIFKELHLTRDHIVARSKGGPDTWDNCVTACKKCNNKKDDKSLTEANLELAYTPYIPSSAEFLAFNNPSLNEIQRNYLDAFINNNSVLKKSNNC